MLGGKVVSRTHYGGSKVEDPQKNPEDFRIQFWDLPL